MGKKSFCKKFAVPKQTPKPLKTAAPEPVEADGPEPLQSPQAQQTLLDIFSQAFGNVLTSEAFPVLLQEVKKALYKREFDVAFGRRDYLEAYAARWSPTRALCYTTVLLGLSDHLDPIMTSTEVAPSEKAQPEEDCDQGVAEPPLTSRALRMLSVGGCAAEHVAVAGFLQDTGSRGSLFLLDSGPWDEITTLLQDKLTAAPSLSKYASASAKAANKALLLPEQLSTRFVQQDALDMEREALRALVGNDPLLVTLLFTLNEMYTFRGIAKTTRFLMELSQVLPEGSLLLVVDSPGSYSEATVGKEKKKYPMRWLLDHTLLESQPQGVRWEKLESQESTWFRLPDTLGYPIPLEDMRYQLHLYQIHGQEPTE